MRIRHAEEHTFGLAQEDFPGHIIADISAQSLEQEISSGIVYLLFRPTAFFTMRLFPFVVVRLASMLSTAVLHIYLSGKRCQLRRSGIRFDLAGGKFAVADR
jgi:hypothetical protein